MNARRALRLLPLAFLLAAILVAGTASIHPTPAAEAQSSNPLVVYSGTLRVDAATIQNVHTAGCEETINYEAIDPCATRLSSGNTFTLYGTTFTIKDTLLQGTDPGLPPRQPGPAAPTGLHVVVNNGAVDTFLGAQFTLSLEDTHLRGEEGMSRYPGNNRADWQGTGLSWRDDERVSVKLTLTPHGLIAEDAGAGRVRLRWNTVGSLATGYEYRHNRIEDGATRTSGWLRVPDSSASTNSHTLSGLLSGTVHTFEVRATAGANGEHKGLPSRPVTWLTAPENVRAVAGNARVTLHWEYHSGTGVTGWEYRLRDEFGGWSSWMDLLPENNPSVYPPSLRSWTVTGLTNRVGHSFQVRAKKSIPRRIGIVGGGGIWRSEFRYVDALGAASVEAPATPGAAYQVPASGDATISSMTRNADGSVTVCVSIPAGATAAAAPTPGPTPGINPTPQPGVTPVPTPRLVPPAAPDNFRAESTEHSVILSWTAVVNATGYQIQHNFSSGLWHASADSVFVGADANPRHVLSNLASQFGGQREYMFRVRAEYNGGAQLGPWSETVTASVY